MSRAYPPQQIAEAFLQVGEIEDALATLDAHLATDPADLDARRLRAAILTRADEPAALRRALADLDALPDDTRLQRSVILERLGEPEAAAAALGDAAADPLIERRVQLALAYGDYAAAERALARVRRWNSRWGQWAGDVQTAAGDHAAARDHYRRALVLLDTYSDTTRNPAMAAFKAGLRLRLGHACRRLGDLAAAEAHYAAAEAIIPDDPLIPFCRGLVACLGGDADRARDLCCAAHARASEHLRGQMRALLAENMDCAYLLEE